MSANNFAALIETIGTLHHDLSAQASKAVNIQLTLRNWLIGFYIAEYEQQGNDRAEYGEGLLLKLSDALNQRKIIRSGERELRRYRQFYNTYPQIRESLPTEFSKHLPKPTASSYELGSVATSSVIASKLIFNLSFTHIAELITIDDSTKRAFYETECLRGNWFVRELKRQMGSLYYERSGLSSDKKKLSKLAHHDADTQDIINIRDPYVFEFLGLKPAEVMSESHLEAQLMDKLQVFLLEHISLNYPRKKICSSLLMSKLRQLEG